MIIKFINKEGNFQELETNTDRNRESKLERNGNVWFEKNLVEVKKEVKMVEVKEEIKEEIKEEVEFDEVKAKEFLKEKKVRGFGLLK